jgi:hypothetical protein
LANAAAAVVSYATHRIVEKELVDISDLWAWAAVTIAACLYLIREYQLAG